jgi:hypothetical protein
MNPGERVGALGRHIASDPLTAESIEAACRERLAGLKTPRTIVIQTEPLPARRPESAEVLAGRLLQSRKLNAARLMASRPR